PGSRPATSKLLITGHDRPVPRAPPDGTIASEVPGDGTLSSPLRSACRTALKKLAPLQNDVDPKAEPDWPLTQWASASVVGVAPSWTKSLPLNPKSIVTTASAGIAGGLSFMPGVSGLVPLVITSGS